MRTASREELVANLGAMKGRRSRAKADEPDPKIFPKFRGPGSQAAEALAGAQAAVAAQARRCTAPAQQQRACAGARAPRNTRALAAQRNFFRGPGCAGRPGTSKKRTRLRHSLVSIHVGQGEDRSQERVALGVSRGRTRHAQVKHTFGQDVPEDGLEQPALAGGVDRWAFSARSGPTVGSSSGQRASPDSAGATRGRPCVLPQT